MKEIWKDINDYEGLYQVSNFGNVRSLEREVMQMNKGGMCKAVYKGQMLKKGIRPNGYWYVVLSRDNIQKKFNVHRLVAIHFIENPKKLPQVNHKDSDRGNCHVSNLEWVNNSSNQKHAFKTGNQIALKGENAPWSKLTDEIVIEIRNKYKNGGYTHQKLADEYGLSRQYVGSLINRRNWNHI